MSESINIFDQGNIKKLTEDEYLAMNIYMFIADNLDKEADYNELRLPEDFFNRAYNLKLNRIFKNSMAHPSLIAVIILHFPEATISVSKKYKDISMVSIYKDEEELNK